MAILKLAPALKDYLWGGQRWIRCWEPIGVTSPITSSVSSISSPSIRRSLRRPATNNRETKNTCESETQVFLFCIVLSDYCLTKCIVTPKTVDLTPPSSFLKVIFASPVSLKPSDNSSQLALVTSSPEAGTAVPSPFRVRMISFSGALFSLPMVMDSHFQVPMYLELATSLLPLSPQALSSIASMKTMISSFFFIWISSFHCISL